MDDKERLLTVIEGLLQVLHYEVSFVLEGEVMYPLGDPTGILIDTLKSAREAEVKARAQLTTEELQRPALQFRV